MAEALYWRLGSVCYMHSHTLVNGSLPTPQTGNPHEAAHRQDLITTARRGIAAFKTLFQVRGLLQFAGAVLPLGESRSNLYDQGILSSTHLLALMYSAELHFWLVQHEDKTQPGIRELKEAGSRLAQTYIQAAGVVPGEGWDTTRAKEILAALSS